MGREGNENPRGNSGIRVLIYTHKFPPSKGGIQTQSLNLARGLQEAGEEVVVLAPSYTSDERELDNKNGLKVIRMPFVGRDWAKWMFPSRYVLAFFYLVVTILRFKPNIVFFIDKVAHTVGGILPFFPFKYIIRVAATTDLLSFSSKEFWEIPITFLRRRLYARAERIICMSYTVKELLERADFPLGEIAVIYNGVENRFLSEPPNAEVIRKLKVELGIRKEEKVILTVARVVKRKGQDSAIKALTQILKEVPNLKYLVVGDGDYKEKIVTLADRLGLRENVVFTGAIPHQDIIYFYDLCDVFVMPNRVLKGKMEGLPNSLIEVAARGKPIVAGANSGSLEVVEHGVSGYLVNPENIDEIGRAILDLLKNEEKALAFGRRGRQKVENLFAEDRMIKDYLKVLESLNITSLKDRS